MGKLLSEYEAVDTAIKSADEYGMQLEVIIWALRAMKENPLLTIEEAIQIGHDEWVK